MLEMSNGSNPWLSREGLQAGEVEVIEPRAVGLPRVAGPQPGVPVPDSADRLARREAPAGSRLWFVGAHGGAGETTLARLLPGAAAAGHTWPIHSSGDRTNVVLVARSNIRGLSAAKRAAADWASRSLPTVHLVGLVIVADAPGKLPKAIRDLMHVVEGAVPRTWSVPWLEQARLDQPIDLKSAPRDLRKLLTDLNTELGI